MLLRTWPSRRKPSLDAMELNPQHPLSRGLLGAWEFNDDAGSTVRNMARRIPTVDGSSDATLVSGGVALKGAVAGNTGGYFNGSTTYSCGDLAYWNPGASGITLLARVRLTTKSSTVGHHQQLISRDDNQRQFQFRVKDTDHLDFIAFFSGAADNDNEGATTIEAGVDYDLAATYDGANIKLYVNGHEDFTQAETRVLDNAGPAASVPLALGSVNASAGGGDFLNGFMAHGRFWGRGLTAQEILWQYVEPYAMYRPRIRRVFAKLSAANVSALSVHRTQVTRPAMFKPGLAR